MEKVEDYRATEDSMRATLLTAQKMADSIVREAEQKRDQMLSQAEADAQAKIGRLRQETEEAQLRLRQGQEELAKFIASVREVCSQELRYLEQLPQLPVDAVPAPTAAEEENTVSQIEEKVLAAFAPEKEEPAEPAPQADPYPEGDPFADAKPAADPAPVDEPTRRINLDDLKFGRNYTGE